MTFNLSTLPLDFLSKMSALSKQEVKVKHKNHLPAEITFWRIKQGDQVLKDEYIGQYEYIQENDEEENEQLAHPISASTAGKIDYLKPVHSIIESCE